MAHMRVTPKSDSLICEVSVKSFVKKTLNKNNVPGLIVATEAFSMIACNDAQQ